SRDPEKRPADARKMLAEVSTTRRLLSDGELDTLGPALATIPTAQDKTMVVDLRESPPRRGDTGPLGEQPAGGGVKRRRSRGPMALLLIVLLALGLSGFAWLYAAVLSKTTTPSLIHMTQSEAKDRAAQDGLDVNVADHEFSETEPKGQVLSTDPDPNDSIDKGGTIGLTLSKGPERYDVPDVIDLQEEVARQEIEDQHLTVAEPVRKYNDKVETGAVISVDPKVGEPLKPGTAVKLVISKGVKPVAVPNVVTLKLEDAQAQLEDAQLRYRVIEKYDDTVPAGNVMKQSPDGNRLAPKNSVITLTVSKGPPLVEVPGVVGLTVAEAQPLIEQAGFVVSVSDFPGGADTVLNQSPNGGEKAPRGSTVTLYSF
ncbi:MAG TPA: PASTA domain-containing protein, partial [Actinomycetes bacterium]|nr:PASTA domain-containing protein [Actinomycetes bacterium]